MESVLSSTEKQGMVSSFLEIAVGQTAETARQFLQATSWQLEEAIQLFYIGNEVGGLQSTSASQPTEDVKPLPGDEDVWQENNGSEPVAGLGGEDEVRPPLPVRREVLYDDATLYGVSRAGHPVHEANSRIAFRNFDEESKRHAVWEADQAASSSAAEAPRDNLASLYRPPFALMYHGSFDKAKVEATHQGKWLLINIQSTKEFSSHILNRDTWANEAVAETIRSNFIFWQVYDDTSEGRKVCTYYNLYAIPVVLVIDPITGQKMRSWNGMVEPERLLEDLVPYLDKGPKDHCGGHSHKRPRESPSAPSYAEIILPDETVEEDKELLQALAASLEDKKQVVKPTQVDTNAPELDKEEESDKLEKKAEIGSSKIPTYPPLPEEPKGDRTLLCRVGVRLPDGRRLQRNFLRTDPIQLLWSFCSSQLNDACRAFRLTQAIPGASRTVDYTSSLTFDESGLANSMISITWE